MKNTDRTNPIEREDKMQKKYITSSESPECCFYPRGCYFDYCTLWLTDEGYVLEGKGRYGCVTEIYLTKEQVKHWLQMRNYG